MVGARPYIPEHGGADQYACNQLTQDLWLPDSKHQLAQQPANDQHQHDLDEEDYWGGQC
jgi:hypothetical protein